MTVAQWNVIVARLSECGLVSISSFAYAVPGAVATAVSLDAHPLVREYYAKQLREQTPDAWREGHRRLYEHLKESVPYQPDGWDGLQPLYQAVAHGSQAGLHQRAFEEVFYTRIDRGQAYGWKKLGAFSSTLGFVGCFYEQPWKRLYPTLSEADQAWLLNESGLCLRALGLTEALEPMRVATEWAAEEKDWGHAAVGASNLSELELTLGDINGALRDAEQSVIFADRRQDAFWRVASRTTHADALHQAGRRAEALACFREAADAS